MRRLVLWGLVVPAALPVALRVASLGVRVLRVAHARVAGPATRGSNGQVVPARLVFHGTPPHLEHRQQV